MEVFLNRLVMVLACTTLVVVAGCATSSTDNSSDGSASEFANFDESGSSTTTESTPAEDSVEKELTESQGKEQQQAQQKAQEKAQEPIQEPVQEQAAELAQEKVDEFAAFEENEPKAQQPVQQAAEQKSVQKVAEPQVPPPEIAGEPEVVPLPVTLVEEPAPVPPPQVAYSRSREKLTQIQRILFKSNDGGGTIAIEADGPMTFTTRSNVNTNQYVVEIPNAKLSKKAARSLNTKDFPGSIGSIDPYQAPGSTTARIVIQMRGEASEPVVQAEGHALLIMAATSAPAGPPPTIPLPQGTVPATPEDHGVGEIAQESKLLSTGSLDEFLGSNQQFYGKKISIEANDAEIRDVIKFISDESGVNLVLNDDVKGKISLKLKQISWDQALVVIMKTKRLGYARQGQVLRIAKVEELKKEEEDFVKITKVKNATLPLHVKMIPVSYAKVDQLVTQVQPFLSERGKVIAELRTSAIVISDIEENIEKIQKLISSLDIPPAQVLIEGKIVEARETFSRTIGLNWQSSGETIDLGSNSKGGRQSVNATSFRAFTGTGRGNGGLNFTLGTLDLLGDLSATLSLGENTGDVKVLSSPRILTLHNEAAEISQNSQIPIFATTSSPTTGNSVTASFKDVKLKLSVTPQVTNDASVIMAVDVNRDFPGEIAEQQTQARPINTRAAKTKVIVRNGQTAVIGGIFQNDSSTGQARIPGLADIPILGWLFKSQAITREKNELMIFLTPRIVGQADSGISAPIPLGNSTDSSSAPAAKGTESSGGSGVTPQSPPPPSIDGGLEL